MPPVGWFENGSLSFAIAANSVGAMASIAVAALAAVIAVGQKNIAHEQKEIARAKLKLDLFEKRLVIFEATWGFLSSALQGSEVQALHAGFTNLFPKAEFLFGTEIRDYMARASSQMTDLQIIDRTSTRSPSGIHPSQVDRRLELETWFHEQASHGCRAKFAPYLDFSAWR